MTTVVSCWKAGFFFLLKISATADDHNHDRLPNAPLCQLWALLQREAGWLAG